MSRAPRQPEASAAIRRRGFLLVLSSPSGAGKTTITHRLVERDPNLSLSVSVDDAPARPRRDRRRRLRLYRRGALRCDGQGRRAPRACHRVWSLLRHAAPPVDEAIAAGRDIVTDIDWQGTQQLTESVPSDLVTVFILPPRHGRARSAPARPRPGQRRNRRRAHGEIRRKK